MRLNMFPPTRTLLHTSRESSSSSSSSFWCLIGNGGMIQRIQSISSTYLHKGIKATRSDLYVDDNKNMNLSCWGIKIRHPLWLLRWQGSLHQLIFLRDQKLAPPLTYMWCNIWYMCYVLLYTSATSDSDAEQRRGCSDVLTCFNHITCIFQVLNTFNDSVDVDIGGLWPTCWGLDLRV